MGVGKTDEMATITGLRMRSPICCRDGFAFVRQRRVNPLLTVQLTAQDAGLEILADRRGLVALALRPGMGSIRSGVGPLKSGNVGYDSSSFVLRTRAEDPARETGP